MVYKPLKKKDQLKLNKVLPEKEEEEEGKKKKDRKRKIFKHYLFRKKNHRLQLLIYFPHSWGKTL